ncbi:hypothetical protein EAF04_007441 [Stromatinia cepivora]|nr:hypothetical protein EAF04_007441 [Stromatinia cepivora]
MDELKAKNISLDTQLELASTKEQELTAEIIAILSQKEELETKLATIQQLQYQVEQLEEKLREANGRADEEKSQKDRAITQRNKELIEKYEACVQRDDAVEAVARQSKQNSNATLGYGAGIKRGRSPTLSLGARERSDMGGGGNNSFSMDEEGKSYGVGPPLQMSGVVKSEVDNMGSNGRLAKKVRRESSEVIELD